MTRPVKTVEQENFHHLVMDIAWFGVGLAATTRFLSVYAIRLGATETELAWISALPAVMLAVSTAFGGWWLRRHPDTVRALYWPALIFRLIFFLPALVPFFPAEFRLTALIVASTLPALAQGISGVTFVVMLRQSVDDSLITRLMSRRTLALNIALCLGALTFGFWLDVAPFPINYQVMFLVAFIFALISQLQLIPIQPIRKLAMPVVTPTVQPKTSPWRSPGFQRVAIITALSHAAFFAIAPIIPLHLVEGLGADEWFMAQFGVVELLAGALVATFGGRIVFRFGNRPVIAVSMLGTAVAALIVALATNPYIALLAAAISGASWSLGVMIGLFGLFAENAPADDMARYTIPYQQTAALGIFLGPMIGSGLARMGFNLVAILLVGAALRLIAGFIIHHDGATQRLVHRVPKPKLF